MVLNDDDRIIVAGGANLPELITSSAYMYSKKEDSWTQLSDMVTRRTEISCRTITNRQTGDLEVIVPGGCTYEGGGDVVEGCRANYLSSVEIYNVMSDSWRVAGKCSSAAIVT